MRIGIIALLHESNTFSRYPTTIESFRQNLLLTGEPVREALASAHHEVGGFFAGLDDAGIEAVPLFAARAFPSGTVTQDAFAELVSSLLQTVQEADRLDGILVAPHGATVSEAHPDADGYWLQQLRAGVGDRLPIVGTLDAHANLSPAMVSACDALIAYRTNPHLDQRERGIEAARLIVRTIRGEVRPTMAAHFPPLAVSIERQCTTELHVRPLYELADRQLQHPDLLSNSILLGFPYADVSEMGAAVIAVTNDDLALARQTATELASCMWSHRDRYHGAFVSVEEAVRHCIEASERTCLLDMGDNVGGGSSADGTELIAALHEHKVRPAFACLFDPESVAACEQAGPGRRVALRVGGKTDQLHGPPIPMDVTVLSLHDGRFREGQPRHGGITDFDQGSTAVVTTDRGLTLMLTSRRMVPFSLEQLRSCGLDPSSFHVLVAKGVNAPIAAYIEVCPQFIRVNTIGSTCADMTRLEYKHRRRPLFPLEPDATWDAAHTLTTSGHNRT